MTQKINCHVYNETPYTNRDDLRVSLDVIIPVYNEEDVLDSLFERLEAVFSPSNKKEYRITSVRYIMVDDGSKDRSAEIIKKHMAKRIPAVLYRFSRNFGHQNAVSAGLQHTNADVVAIIDADLQDPPEAILEMLAKWREGYDVVYGERRKRKENFIKVGSYWLFYRLLAFLSEINIPLDSGDFSLMDRRVIQAMRDLPEKLRFPRVLRAWVGFRQTGLSYERSQRAAGATKYSFSKLYRLATDGVASASIRPLRMAQLFSIFYLILVSALALLSFSKLWSHQGISEIGLWFLFSYLLISLGSFVQTFCIYILSSYVGRTYLEVKGRPPYVILEVIDKGNDATDLQNQK